MRYEQVKTDSGTFTVSVPNTTSDGDGFYISYNGYDTDIYGGATTAIVVGQMQAFYILMGDHQKQLKALVPEGLEACLDYYRQNIALSHKYSDKLPEMTVAPDAEEEPSPSAPGM